MERGVALIAEVLCITMRKREKLVKVVELLRRGRGGDYYPAWGMKLGTNEKLIIHKYKSNEELDTVEIAGDSD